MYDPHATWTRLPLAGVPNARELGGYPVPGGSTQFRRFVRSDSLNRATESDLRFLYEYGVRSVIDLRDPQEDEYAPDPSLGPDVVCFGSSLLNIDISDMERIEREIAAGTPDAVQFYRMMLNNRRSLREIFTFIADAPEGTVLFHCTVGKDRTGVISMLLMDLAGCDLWDIVGNYVQTRANLMRHPHLLARWAEVRDTPLQDLVDSPARTIEATYAIVHEGGRSCEDFLLECGVDAAALARVRARLVEP